MSAGGQTPSQVHHDALGATIFLDRQTAPEEQSDVHDRKYVQLDPCGVSIRVMQVLHQGGGSGSVTSTLHLSVGLQRAGVNVLLVCPPDSEVATLAHAAGLETHPLSLHPGDRRRNAGALADLLRRCPVDIINSQSARDRQALTWLGLRRRLPVPLVVTRRQMPRTLFFENWVMSRVATRVVAVSEAVADALRRRGTPANKLAIIHNGLVTERLDDPVTPQQLEHWRKRIGWRPHQRNVGIVARAKDQHVVMKALAHVRAPVRLVMAGVDPSGPLGMLARRVEEPHAAVCVPFTSPIRPLYDLLELVLLPSRMEGLSQSLLEAMALGKPVLASASGSNAEVITTEVSGLLVDPLDAGRWGAAIDRLLADPALCARLGAAARRRAREDFSLARTVDRTIELYRSILVGRTLAASPPPR